LLCDTGVSTITDRAAALEVELTAIETALTSLLTGGQSASMDGISKTGVSFESLQKRKAQIIRSLQRLSYGGRMISINVSGASVGGALPQVTEGI
jgi:hypothetical protein